MRRAKHNLSHYRLASFDQGELVPVACMEVLPGDSFRHQTRMLLRVTPLQTPVMHPVLVRLHSWFVPNRLLWTGWEDFITGVSATPPPTINVPLAGVAVGGLANHLGLPAGAIAVTQNVSALPFRAYNLIWNEFYRDQNLQAEIATDNTTLQRVSWEKDYFTTARPLPQEGVAVPVPVRNPAILTSPVAAGTLVGNVNIADWRQSLALQQLKEHRSQFGSRYVDYLRYLGITPSDARMGRPEYLGGGKQTIAFSEVLATAETGSTVKVGDLAGHGIAAVATRPYNRFFEEHGWVLTLASVRPKAIYIDGLERKWSRTTQENFWQRETEIMGEQEVFNRELFFGAADSANVFGYQGRHDEYRREQSRVTGEFESILGDWHFARDFSATPVLNSSFITCTPQDRPFADKTVDELQSMVVHQIAARRLVSKVSRV